MRLTQFPVFTSKDTPADAEIVSHQLMLRAGMIRRLAAGLYTWTPLGLKVLRKVEGIVREEMNAAGAVELLMPSIHPAELWQESGRWEAMGAEMLRLKDRHERDYCYGPTHEEVITALVRQDFSSYKQLPVNFYQIQTKFRDEIRPRFGVMRAREFIMKDAYSFNLDETSLAESYAAMRAAYTRIFERIGVEFRIVEADSGNIGGAKSEEFHVLAGSGEDLLAVSDAGGYAANVEAATCPPADGPRPAPGAALAAVETPGVRSIEALCQFLDRAPATCLKTLIVKNGAGELHALCLRGDHEINIVKAAKALDGHCELAGEDEIFTTAACQPGYIGPVGLDIPVLVDHAAAALADFACGANRDDAHLTGVNWERDLPLPAAADLRQVEEGDPAPDGGRIRFMRGIEVGHIFQLGQKYTRALGATVLDADGRDCVPQMGCYGIGISRVVAAVIEQCHDDNGICWPAAVAPFRVLINPINPKGNAELATAIGDLYRGLQKAGIDVLLDDRGLRPGQMFADADLLGIPLRIVAGERGLAAGELELKGRTAAQAEKLPWSLEAVLEKLNAL
mgnify:CR=1 FL=1